MHPNRFDKLVKECVVEVFKETLEKCPECGSSKCNCKIVKRVEAYIDLKKKVDALHDSGASPEEIEPLQHQIDKERIWVRSILNQAGYGAQSGMYPREEQQEGLSTGNPLIPEGFDPLSQGPNPDCKENPYPAWNAHMRTLEENLPQVSRDDLMYYIENGGLTDWEKYIVTQILDGRSLADIMKSEGQQWNISHENLRQKMNKAVRKIRVAMNKEDREPTLPNPTKLKTDRDTNTLKTAASSIDVNETHGRYAQDAGAGVFDPRTFGLGNAMWEAKTYLRGLKSLTIGKNMGRYAQKAGAGQFDLQSFGKLDENLIVEKMDLDTAWEILVSYCTGAVHHGKYHTIDTVNALSWALNRLKVAMEELEVCKHTKKC